MESALRGQSLTESVFTLMFPLAVCEMTTHTIDLSSQTIYDKDNSHFKASPTFGDT